MDLSTPTLVAMSMFTFVAVSFIILETYGFAVHYKVETWPRHPIFAKLMVPPILALRASILDPSSGTNRPIKGG